MTIKPEILASHEAKVAAYKEENRIYLDVCKGDNQVWPLPSDLVGVNAQIVCMTTSRVTLRLESGEFLYIYTDSRDHELEVYRLGEEV